MSEFTQTIRDDFNATNLDRDVWNSFSPRTDRAVAWRNQVADGRIMHRGVAEPPPGAGQWEFQH